MNVAAVLLWVTLIGGIVPSLWFLTSFRPSWPPRSPAFVVTGLVGLIALLYVRGALTLAVRGWEPHFQGFADAAISIGLGLVGDAGLVYLLVTFRRFRATWREEMHKRSNDNGEVT